MLDGRDADRCGKRASDVGLGQGRSVQRNVVAEHTVEGCMLRDRVDVVLADPVVEERVDVVNIVAVFRQHELQSGKGATDLENPGRSEVGKLKVGPGVLIGASRGVRLKGERPPLPLHSRAAEHNLSYRRRKSTQVLDRLAMLTIGCTPGAVPLAVVLWKFPSSEHVAFLTSYLTGHTISPPGILATSLERRRDGDSRIACSRLPSAQEGRFRCDEPRALSPGRVAA